MDERIEAEMTALLPRLRRFAHGLTGTAADGDDLVQSTCERAILNLDKWRHDTRLDSWMFRIAQNLHRNAIRDRKVRDRIVGEARDVIGPYEETKDDQEWRLTWAAVRSLLARLPFEHRCVLLLVCVEGYSYAETAAILGVPMGTVTSRLARARQNIAAMYSAGNDGIGPLETRSRNG